MEKSDKLIIEDDRSSIEAKEAAIEHMWTEKIRSLLAPNQVVLYESLPEASLKRIKEEKVKLYFDGLVSPNFGFREGPIFDDSRKPLSYEPDAGFSAQDACYSPDEI